MLGNAAIVHFLESRGVRHIFHLPGIHTLPLARALKDSKIGVLTGRHEASLAFAADGLARATGLAAIVLVTPGCGLGNVAGACMEAYADDVPLVIMWVEVEQKDVARGILHGVERPETLFRHISKAVVVIPDGKGLVPGLERAFRTAVSPRRGPVLISLPYRLLEAEAPFPAIESPPEEKPAFDPGPLEASLKGAQNPVILGGAALMEAAVAKALSRLCREAAIPFLSTTGGKGVVREDVAPAFGNVAAGGITREILEQADVVIAFGTRLRAVDTKRRGVKLRRLVHIDVDGRWQNRNYPTRAAVIADMKEATDALSGFVRKRKFAWDMEGLDKARREEQAKLMKEHEGARICALLRHSIPPETVTVWDQCLVSYWAERYFPAFSPRTFIMPGGLSPVFYGLPAGLGAKLARPDAPCLCVAGDGSFCATTGELATIKQHHIPLVMLVHNNESYGVLEETMRRRYQVEGTMDLFAPDFVALARAFDIKAARARSLEGLRRILGGVTWEEPQLIEFSYPSLGPPW